MDWSDSCIQNEVNSEDALCAIEDKADQNDEDDDDADDDAECAFLLLQHCSGMSPFFV